MKTLAKKENNIPALEIEVALGKISQSDLLFIEGNLPSEYFIEDRTRTGWGVILLNDKEYNIVVDGAVYDFLEPLIKLKSIIIKYNGTLRIAVYYSTITCTLKLDIKDLLMKFNLLLEISMYPVSND